MDATNMITTKKMFLFFIGCVLLIALHECTENIPRSSSSHKEEKMMENAGPANLDCNEMKCADQLPCWCCYDRTKGTFCLPTEDSCKTVCKTLPPATHN
ncbi:hypothetical protein MKX01_027339 [Papaver californicum]|nr:hypothetical protein MKX01_027339 [Papaver californicum]